MSHYPRFLVPAVLSFCAMTPGFRAKAPNAGVFMHGLKGETLVDDCKAVERTDTTTNRAKKDDVEKVAACMGFVTGVLDADLFNDTGEDGRSAHRHHYCIPDDATATQLGKIVAGYGIDHPEELNEPGVALVIFAMRRAFPCG